MEGPEDDVRRLVAEATVPGTVPTQSRPAVPASAPGAARPSRVSRHDLAVASTGGRQGLSWTVLLLSIAMVFVLALIAITAFELVAGKPISTVLGSGTASHGTSAGNLFTPASTTTSTSTTTTTTSATTTSTTTTSSTTTTTAVEGASPTSTALTTTTAPRATTTSSPTTTAPASTTTAPSGASTTTQATPPPGG